MACWSCERSEGEGPLCDKCGAIQPPRPRTHFEMIGLPARFDIDPADLEARYKEISRKVHPDRHARAEARARRYSLQQSTAVNDAYRTLRDSRRRAEYLLSLSGIEIDADRAAQNGKRTVKAGATLLAEMMELGERIADAKTAGADRDTERIAAEVRQRRERAMAEVERGLTRADAAPPDAAALEAVGEKLAALRYYDRFLAGVDRSEEHA